MKKLLLLAAIMASVLPTYADGFSDCFKLTWEGETVEPGQTITVSNYYDPFVMDYPDYAGMFDPSYEAKAEIYATNVSNSPLQLLFRAKMINPSLEDFNASEDMGNLLLCYDFEEGMGNCLANSFVFDNKLAAVESGKYIMIDAKQSGFTDMTSISFELEMVVKDGNKEVASTSVFVNLSHEHDITMAVEGIESIEAQAQYFTIQGLRVIEPQKGQLYIERKGSKVTKRIF